MSQHVAFRRQPVPQQAAQRMQPITMPAPNRGIIENENKAFMQPGGAVVQDNWRPTMRGAALRGGSIEWIDLHAGLALTDPLRKPVISSFEYASGNVHKMFAGQADKLYEVTFSGSPILVKSGQTSGNYSSTQLANAADDFLIVVNESGDYPLRFDGSTWTVLDYQAVPIPSNLIHGPVGTTVEHGRNLTYVCKYRRRLYFIEGGSMNAWYLGIDAIGGALQMIPLSGAATKGGHLLFAATWSIDAGDGIDDKLCFVTNFGEILIFTGSNPGDENNWRQEGRYQIGRPMGMNAHAPLGGDLLIATVDGVTPVSASITKDSQQLELAMITVPIKEMWRREAQSKTVYPWTLERWDEYGCMFVTWPGGKTQSAQWCGLVNTATGAWARYSWDAMCWIRMRGDMFFGTQQGRIMQADRSGYDDGKSYVCTLVGGWEMFNARPWTVTWRQARCNFTARAGEPFNPQVSACVDYVLTIPPPPLVGSDPGNLYDVWDQGLWDDALWDAPAPVAASVRNTGWVSIGATGYAHAPVIQVTMAQQTKPDVELISIAATYERAGVTV